MKSNLTYLTRDQSDPFQVGPDSSHSDKYYHGLAGDYVRISPELDWEKKFIGPGGQVITPFASLRGDFSRHRPEPSAYSTAILAEPRRRERHTLHADRRRRLELADPDHRGTSSHVIEPKLQLIARPDEPLAGSCRTTTPRASSSTIRSCSSTTIAELTIAPTCGSAA